MEARSGFLAIMRRGPARGNAGGVRGLDQLSFPPFGISVQVASWVVAQHPSTQLDQGH